MGNELVLVKDLLKGKKIVNVREIGSKDGCSALEFLLGENNILEFGLRRGLRANGAYLYYYLSFNGKEIYNDVDGQIKSINKMG